MSTLSVCYLRTV